MIYSCLDISLYPCLGKQRAFTWEQCQHHPVIYLNDLLAGGSLRLDLGLLGGVRLLGRAVDRDTLLDETHLSGEGGVGDPGARVAGRHFLEHSVDLLKGEPLGLGHEEVCEENADNTKGAPHEEDLR
jgi:hypothetical protein